MHSLRHLDRTHEALMQTKGDKLSVTHQMVMPKSMSCLALVHLMIARHDDDPRQALAIDKRHGLACHRLRHAEHLRKLSYRSHSGSCYLLHLPLDVFDDSAGGARSLHIGRKPAVIAIDKLSLTSIGKSHELYRCVATDLARVSNHRQGDKAAARAIACIGSLLLLITSSRALLVGCKRVGVFHNELTAAHKAEAGTQLVTELILNVVKHQGKLLVAPQLSSHEVSVRLLVRRPKAKFPIMAILDAHQLGAIGVETAGLLPKLSVGKNRCHHFLTANGSHLLANDVFYFENGTPSERQVTIKPSSLLAYHAGTK